MLRKFLLLSAVALFVFCTTTLAFAAAPNWNIAGTWTFNDIYGTPYVHTMTITSFNLTTGAFSGTGSYNADPTLTWAITGTESGSNVTYHLLVLTVAPGVTIDGTGVIASSGFMSGTGYQSNIPGPVGVPNITWNATGSAALLPPTNKDQCKGDGWKTFTNPVFKNQGDCVSYTNHIPVSIVYGPYPSTGPDSGVCGQDWATDSFDRYFTVTQSQNSNGTYTVTEDFKNGSFVTFAGQSPGFCQTLGAGVKGTFQGSFTIVVTGGNLNPNGAPASGSPLNQTGTVSFIAAVFGAGATYDIPSFVFNYTTKKNGKWQNASADKGGNIGDITGNP